MKKNKTIDGPSTVKIFFMVICLAVSIFSFAQNPNVKQAAPKTGYAQVDGWKMYYKIYPFS